MTLTDTRRQGPLTYLIVVTKLLGLIIVLADVLEPTVAPVTFPLLEVRTRFAEVHLLGRRPHMGVATVLAHAAALLEVPAELLVVQLLHLLARLHLVSPALAAPGHRAGVMMLTPELGTRPWRQLK